MGDNFGRRPAMVIGQLAAAAGCLGTAGAQTYLYDVTEKAHLQPIRGVVIGCQGGLIAASYVIGPAVGGFLTQLYGPSVAYCAVSSVLVAVAGACAVLPESRVAVSPWKTSKSSP